MQVFVAALETALLAWLVVVRPIRRRGELRALAAGLDEAAQVGLYRPFLRFWWSVAAVAAALMLADGAPLGLTWPRADALGQVGLIAVALAGSVAMAAVVPPFRRFFLWQVRRLGLAGVLFPRSRRAAAWFVPVAVTAGICEELVFRGLVPVWVAHFPGGDGALPAVVASAAMFGLGHVYQGWRGVVLTGVLGGWLCVLALQSGSLLPAMAVHALVDLRIVALFLVVGPVPVPASRS